MIATKLTFDTGGLGAKFGFQFIVDGEIIDRRGEND